MAKKLKKAKKTKKSPLNVSQPPAVFANSISSKNEVKNDGLALKEIIPPQNPRIEEVLKESRYLWYLLAREPAVFWSPYDAFLDEMYNLEQQTSGNHGVRPISKTHERTPKRRLPKISKCTLRRH